MGSIDALRNAVEKQAANLDPAQREFVLAQMDTYEWNDRQKKECERQLEEGVFNGDGDRLYDAEGKLFNQRHKLVAEQSTLFSHIMRWLKGTAVQESELDAFLDA